MRDGGLGGGGDMPVVSVDECMYGFWLRGAAEQIHTQ